MSVEFPQGMWQPLTPPERMRNLIAYAGATGGTPPPVEEQLDLVFSELADTDTAETNHRRARSWTDARGDQLMDDLINAQDPKEAAAIMRSFEEKQ